MTTPAKKLIPAFLVSAAMMIGVLALVLLADDDQSPDESGSGGNAEGDRAGVGGGEGPQLLDEPRRVTEGDATFVGIDDLPGPDDTPKDEIIRYQVGEVINGIVISDGSGGVKSACPEAAISGESSAVTLTYLPSNAFEIAEPVTWSCGDGSLAAAFLKYSIGERGLSFISVNYARVAGDPSAVGTGPVEAITINGQPGVAIQPQVYEGKEIGQGSVVFKTSSGAVEVIGYNIPLAETIKIAEGIQCEGC